MNFSEIVYSISSSKSKVIYNSLSLIDSKLLTKNENKLLQTLLSSYLDTQSFPSYEFLCQTFGQEERKCKSTSDVVSALKELLNNREVSRLKSDVTEILMEDTSALDLREKVSKKLSKQRLTVGSSLKKINNYGDKYRYRKQTSGGFKSNIKEVDEITSGFQYGLVASIAAFTSHGKSTCWNNAAYVNMKEGKNVLIWSGEIPQEIVYMILLSRFSYDYGKKLIPYERAVKFQLSKEEEDFMFGELEEAYHKLSGNILIIGSEDIPSWSYEGIMGLYRNSEQEMGGLDYVIWDHVNLFKYVDPNKKLTGDDVIKIITDVGKAYRTERDTLIGTGLSVQCNREGFLKAKKNEGRYNMLALSDFNEIERSSTYVIFLYSDSYMMKMNEMKVQLQKHRIGRVMDDPIITYIYPECSVIGESFTSPTMDVNVLDDFLDSGMNDFNF